jgi:hypothetical protein
LSFSISYPYWFILICAAVGLLFALLMYTKNNTFTKSTAWLLSILRFATGFITTFLLLNPVLKWMNNTTEKPIIVLMQDNSKSQEKAFTKINKNQYTTTLTETINKLGKNYVIKQYSYGNKVKDTSGITLLDNSTDIAEALEQISSTYENENLGAIIISGDGIYNKGANPALLSLPIKASLYAIGLGDTTLNKDALLQNIYCNKIVYSGDKFAVKLDALGIMLNNENAVINIKHKSSGKIVGTKTVQFNGNKSSKQAEIILDAIGKGVQQYTATISNINGEVNTVNNSQDFYVDVIDSKEKILLLSNAPHPDIFAIREALKVNKNLDIEVTTIDQFKGNASDYNLIVMHNLPSAKNNCSNIISAAKSSGCGLLYIVGNQTNLTALNGIQSAVSIKSNTSSTTDALGIYNKGFNYFTINEANANKISALPPIQAAFGQYSLGPNTQVLFNQKIGSVSTQNALWAMQQQAGVRCGVIAAEGIWRWRLYDYIQHKNHQIIDEFIQKTIQFLVVKQDKKPFKAHVSKSIFSINESIAFDAELYNDNYELITPNEVNLIIANNKSERFTYTLNKNEKNYSLDIGTLPAGEYNFEARTSYNGKNYNELGAFKVVDIDIENSNTVADFNLMQQLSNKYGGKFLYPSQVAELANLIPKDKNVNSVIKSELENEPLINWKWLFGVLLALLATEWFVRKRSGGY